MTHDPWTGVPVDDGLPFAGRVAVLAGFVAALAGALVVAGAVVLVDHIVRRGRR